MKENRVAMCSGTNVRNICEASKMPHNNGDYIIVLELAAYEVATTCLTALSERIFARMDVSSPS